ncbi:MAG: CRISPR system precrRNA processing endoribonuclease RAMP protein Cas6 [Thermodesulfobacteriota bacterium]|nr:CRISPR system precrRNA processing endoribonuclease RAMP protein Cas6 [Thermodesulfobacteriota bacterium]
MQYGRYNFYCLFEDDAILPEYKGSTFRGILGHALKKVVCALKKQDCKECLLRERCVYSFVFETSVLKGESAGKKRIASPPPPYVIEPPENRKTFFKKGEPFDFVLILFGRANDYITYFIYAFEQMGRMGMGRRIGGKRAGFLLERVYVDDNIIYSSKSKQIKGGAFTSSLVVEASPVDEAVSVNRLELTLNVPLRLKFENRFEASLSFHVLVRAMLRRISSLNNYYGDNEPLLDYRGLVKRAKSVDVIKSSLTWFDWKRYSNKQDRSMLMGGIIGKVVYSGELSEFLPLIKFCENVHIGKQTTFGLGKIKLTGVWQ